jgi:hypothetical protein
MARVDRQFRLARQWSNREVRRLGALFTGDIVNVSGWLDDDKEGGKYAAYFPNRASYAITNYGGTSGSGADGEIPLDLESDLSAELARRFDVVFNHTALEHIFEVRKAFANLCAMSRDLVVVVVPFAQVEHYTDSFGDYWRFTPQAIKRMFETNGFTEVYCAVSPDPDAAVYVLSVGARDAAKWTGTMPPSSRPPFAADWLGRARGWGGMIKQLKAWVRR